MKPSVLVVSHERSGTHYLINTIAKNFGYPMLEESILGDPDILYKKIVGLSGAEIIIKGHHQYEWFEKHMPDILNKARVVYIHRDGKDVLASCFHYMHKHRGTGDFPETTVGGKPDFGHFIRQNPSQYNFDGWYSKDKSSSMPERWAKHVNGWKGRDGVLVVSYESLKLNFADTVREIGAHIGLPILPRCPIEPTLKDRGIDNRLGVIGDSKNVFTKPDEEFFNAHETRIVRDNDIL